MTGGQPGPHEGPALVPGELRGYRQFELRPDGLYPLVHTRSGPWSGEVQEATCALGKDHAPPAAECRCGLYAWYLPGSATVAIGPVSAVVAARGRCVLGDRGFRAAAARIEAVSLPAGTRLNPSAAARAREMLHELYPTTRVYSSTRRMLKDFPPHDVGSLGIRPPPDRSRVFRAAMVVMFVVAVVVTGFLAALPRYAVAQGFTSWWPLLVVSTMAWQVGLIWLMARLMALQVPRRIGGPPTPP